MTSEKVMYHWRPEPGAPGFIFFRRYGEPWWFGRGFRPARGCLILGGWDLDRYIYIYNLFIYLSYFIVFIDVGNSL